MGNYGDRVCITCNEKFSPKGPVQKKCTPCNNKWNKRSFFEKWVDKKPRKPAIRSNNVSYSFFMKKHTVPNNVYRG